MTPNPSTPAVRERLRGHLGYYRDQLETLSAFWLRCSLDETHGGYFVPTSVDGRTIGRDKNLWCQARMTWMFAALYNHYEPRDVWLDAARLGRRFLVEHGYAGEGRWRYLLSAEGELFIDERSLITDHNAAMALAEFARASGDDADRPLIEATLRQYLRRIQPPIADEWYHQSLSPAMSHNTVPMVTLGGHPALLDYFEPGQADAVGAAAVEQVLYTQANDEHRVIFESVGPDGRPVDSPSGQRVNPGHALEAAWFCIHEALRQGRPDWIERAAQTIRWSFEVGWDPDRGGLLAFTRPGGGPPPGPEAAVPWGERWNDRIWWVHSEALYALACAAWHTGDPWFADRFDALTAYVDRHFVDHEHGEWLAYLDENGQPIAPQKGTWIKSFFHLPRNVMMLCLLMRDPG
jgi:N-acylglucosamine 2-epimerase